MAKNAKKAKAKPKAQHVPGPTIADLEASVPGLADAMDLSDRVKDLEYAMRELERRVDNLEDPDPQPQVQQPSSLASEDQPL